ncbi:MAG: VanZ family protein [bacterium]
MRQDNLRNRVGRYGPLLLWMVLIWFASTRQFSALNTSQVLRPLILWIFPNLSESRVAAIHFVIRKAGHFSEYAVMGLLAARAFSASAKEFLRQHWWLVSFTTLFAYALLDELHQSFVPERTASIYDSAIDVIGGITALFVFKLWRRRSTGVSERRGRQ